MAVVLDRIVQVYKTGFHPITVKNKTKFLIVIIIIIFLGDHF